jgi:uncharacterized protein
MLAFYLSQGKIRPNTDIHYPILSSIHPSMLFINDLHFVIRGALPASRVIFLAAVVLMLSGCTILGAAPQALPTAQADVPPVLIPSSTPSAVLTAAPSATAPAVPSATATPSPTATALPTATPTPSPTLHPMNILAMRQTPYPGSEIVIEETLERGTNYSRYIASYRSEGLKIYALLTIPDGEMPPGGWPSIVFNHGYIPPAQYRTTERYIAYVDWLARSGYIVFRIDYRGHDRSEGAARGAYSDPGYTNDVLNAVGALKQYPLAHPERIGMWGHSMGGYLTLRSMVISPDIKAGVIWAGVVASYPDLLTHWRRAPGPTPTPSSTGARGWRTGWVEQFGSPDENPELPPAPAGGGCPRIR